MNTEITKVGEDTNKSMYNYMLDFSPYRNNLNTMCVFDYQISFDKFITEVENIARYLMSIGVKKGDNVCLCLPNYPQAIMAIYAINRTGAIINVVHPLLHAKGLAEIIEKTRSKAIFMADNLYYKYALAIRKLNLEKVILCSIADYMPKKLKRRYRRKIRKYLRLGWVMKKMTNNIINYSEANTTEYFKFPEIKGSDIAIYMHSGGTTGEPKTIMISNHAINSLPKQMLTSISEGENGYHYSYKDVMYSALPLFHGYGLGVCVHASLCVRMKLLLVPRFVPKETGLLIEKNKVTAMAAVPRMYQKMIGSGKFDGKKLKHLKNAYCGGDKMEEDIKNDFDNLMKKNDSTCVLQEGYGLTETVNVCILNTNKYNKPNSIGKPLNGMDAIVVDADNNVLPARQNGELCISSDTMMSGYYDDEETTNMVIFTDNSGKKWLKTGDLAYIDEEGFVFFVDRLKRLIKISGMNVFPAEIERVVTRLDFIEQACAVKAKQNFKTIIVLNIKLAAGVKYNEEKEKQIIEHCAENLSKWAQPTLIIVRNELPTTVIGKIDFKALEGKTD